MNPPNFTSDDLKVMTAETWKGLAALAACGRDQETRARASGLIERAIDVYRIESYDEFRSRIMATGDRDALRVLNQATRETLEEHVEAVRGGLRIALSGQAVEGTLGEVGSKLTDEGGKEGFEYCCAMVLAWDAARLSRSQPDKAATPEEWAALQENLLGPLGLEENDGE